jgi:hypothetical protein
LAWAAGYLEGDGCITGRDTKSRIQLSTTDADCVERFARIIDGTVSGPHANGPRRKSRWTASRSGVDAICKLYTAFEPYLGNRRRSRFQEAILGVSADGPIIGWSPSGWTWAPWAAGLFEAEGCVSFSGTPILELVTTDRDVAERFADVVSGSVLGPYQPPPTALGTRCLPQYRWCVGGKDEVRRVATLFRPWLGARRRRRLQEVLVDQIYRKRPGQATFPDLQLWG